MYIIHALHEYIYVFMQDMCVYRLMYTLYMQIYTSVGPIGCALCQAELIRLPGLSYVGFAELRFSMEGTEWEMWSSYSAHWDVGTGNILLAMSRGKHYSLFWVFICSRKLHYKL